MGELHLPWIELAILVPLIGGLVTFPMKEPERVQRIGVTFFALTLLLCIGEWIDFGTLHVATAHDRWDVLEHFLHFDPLLVDELSAPLLPMLALLHLLAGVVTMRTKLKRYPFAGSLISESLVLALFSCKEPVLVVGCLLLNIVPHFFELRARRQPTRVYLLHMGLFALLLVIGSIATAWEATPGQHSISSVIAAGSFLAAVLLRSGIAPVHCWITDLFEHASFGNALLRVTPMAGAYAAVRLVLPIAPDWALRSIAVLSLITAVYAASMTLVQKEARRFFAYLFLSNSALVLVGLETATPISLTGALSVWISVAMSLTGFGLTLRAIEARMGRVSLTKYHGLYEHSSTLAKLFLLTGLASVGFPGTFGFVGTELLVDGAVQAYPLLGVGVVIAAALNGIAVLNVYFRVFTGRPHSASIAMRSRPSERFAVLTLTVLIVGGGLLPQPGIASRHRAAEEIVRTREKKALRMDENELAVRMPFFRQEREKTGRDNE